MEGEFENQRYVQVVRNAEIDLLVMENQLIFLRAIKLYVWGYLFLYRESQLSLYWTNFIGIAIAMSYLHYYPVSFYK